MSPPTGATATEPGAVAYQAVGDTEPTLNEYQSWCAQHERDPLSARSQQSYLMEDGCTRNEARLLIKAYELDQRDAHRSDAESFARAEFGGWLRSNYWRCVNRRPKPRLGGR